MSKYDPVWKYLKSSKKDEVILSFEKIREILGFEIDHSFLTYKKEAGEYGYGVDKISLKEKTVKFEKVDK